MKANSLKIKLLAIVTMAAMSFTAFSQALGPVQDSPDGPWYMPGEVLIKFRTNATDLQLQGVVQAVGIQSARQIHTPAMKASGNAGITHAFIARPVAQAIQALRNHPAVEYAEPNWVYTTHQYTSNDPLFVSGSLWGMYGDESSPANIYGSQAAEAWVGGRVGSRSVAVGIIDEGFQFTHPDLAANVWVNPGETVDNNIDDDGNGYTDDIHGWDFYENNNTIYDGTEDDHGTHVSGTVGAVGGNGLGVAGVNWAVTLISGKFLGPNGGTTDAAIRAVDYFTALKTRSSNPVNIVALNNSWGGGGYSQALHDAIIRAAKAGILFVAASGNGNRAGKAINTDSTPVYPGCYNTAVGTSTESAAPYGAVISVTAIDSSGNKASFANYGATTVDLGAPGVSINSTLPPDTYGAYSGTSMATPHVTGAVALYASVNPTATAFEIKEALLKAVTATPSLAGKTSTGGRLDLSTVIAPTTTYAPAAPSDLAALGITYSQIRLTWKDNSDNETRFEITRTPDGGTPVTIVVAANLTSYTDSSLDEQTFYTYTISACNSGGCTPATDPATATATTLLYVTPTVKWVGVDINTKGDWINKYGSEGYDIVRYKQAPAYGTVTPKDHNTVDPWAVTPDTTRALQTADGSSRFFACYFKEGEFYLDVNLDNNPHRVSIYCVDADRVGRVQEITVLDPYGSPLTTDTYTLTSFGEGQYLTWDITGHVLIKFKWIAPVNYNAVVSGIFFDDPSYVPPTPALPAAPSSLTAKAISSSAITLSWVDNATNEDGFEIQRSTSSSFISDETHTTTTGPNVRTFTDTGLSRLTTYYYRVRATSGEVFSAFSNTAYAKTKR